MSHVWCVGCTNKKPPRISRADFLVPVRVGYYDLSPDLFNIDARVVGVCKACLADKNAFQRNNVEQVNAKHKHLVYTSA